MLHVTSLTPLLKSQLGPNIGPSWIVVPWLSLNVEFLHSTLLEITLVLSNQSPNVYHYFCSIVLSTLDSPFWLHSRKSPGVANNINYGFLPFKWASMHNTRTLNPEQLKGIQSSLFYFSYLCFSYCDMSKCHQKKRPIKGRDRFWFSFIINTIKRKDRNKTKAPQRDHLEKERGKKRETKHKKKKKKSVCF